MTDSMRDRIERELGKDRLHELDKPVFGGRQLSDKQIEGIADALLAAFPWLADDAEDEHLRVRAEATEAKIAAVREYIVAVQNSPGLTETGHHRRWLREALAVLDGAVTDE